ncbi:MAG: twin-arginine translocation signal domain-containing protein [Planctomycetes bacterium]|nr:twin-arginine translocation signal domain-containing protein [Planctomycetota bacterium]
MDYQGTSDRPGMSRRSFVKRVAATTAVTALPFVESRAASAETKAKKPHPVFVVGTHHYSPQVSMPVLAKAIRGSVPAPGRVIRRLLLRG